MPRRVSVPSYRLHKQSGQAIVTLRDALGKRHDVLLGPHDTDESHAEYARVIAEWTANGRRYKACAPLSGLSVNELILAYWPHVETYYRHPDGSPTSEVANIKLALRRLRLLHGHRAAEDIDADALDGLRASMIQEGLCRNRINKDVARIKRLFKWAAGKKLAPIAVYHSLQTLEGLRAGRSEARETAPVRPVSEAVVEATLPHLRPQVAAMVRLQWLTGMRPGEVTVMRTIDLEMSGKVWLYRPGSNQGRHGKHKTAHHGQERIIPIGPRAQEVLRPWLRLNLTEYLFQPRESRAQFDAERRLRRKSKVTPSQARRQRKARPKKILGERYSVCAYDNAIAAGCDRAFPPQPPLLPRDKETKRAWGARLTAEEKAELAAWREAHRWHPHQLRHAKATEIRREAGLDAARAVLSCSLFGRHGCYSESFSLSAPSYGGTSADATVGADWNDLFLHASDPLRSRFNDDIRLGWVLERADDPETVCPRPGGVPWTRTFYPTPDTPRSLSRKLQHSSFLRPICCVG